MRTTKKVVAGLATAALAVGVGLGVNAASGSTGGSNGDEDSPKFTSSITVADDDAEEAEGTEKEGTEKEGTDRAHEAADAAESAELAKLPGVISAAQAEAAALKSVAGTADSSELENQDGNVVWTVQVTDGAGTKTTVFIDAGTGNVLATKAHDHEDNDEGGDE